MIIAQHRKFTPFNILFVSIMGLILCLGIFLHLPPKIVPVFLEPAVNNLIGLKIGDNLTPAQNVFTTLALTLLQAFFLNSIINHFNFLGKPNFTVALLYMTLVSLFPPFLVLSPPLICNFITIWMLGKLFNIYKLSDVKGLMFDLGLIVAIGSLIYFPFIVMMLLLWISLVIFRPFNWREWITPLLGFITIYFLLGVIYLWIDRIAEFYLIFKPLGYFFPTELGLNLYDYLVTAPIFVALLFFLYVLKDHFFKSVVHLRKSFQLLFFMILLTIGSFYLNSHITINHFLLCAPPVAIYLAFYFTNSKSKWVYEVLYLIIILTIIYFQFI
ncbi:DUF6427 family protein [Sphingobacterium psychroaquaticum]|uniref:Beta-carotene 15,15'-monooxygenase n=1 Tax=Sphingobacterium psychroaquaticum TaxID=561061 RepID=A0A1X7J5C4_9SPHI|nr:DUF6427 family protein [Sphingobacterium psychroaquaticum]SMG22933.1 hypothetical protein SAMN05660862_1475 [Sphingobacterium psychroaquaticum]